MAFDIQYDRDGNIKPNKQLEQSLNEAANAIPPIPIVPATQQSFYESAAPELIADNSSTVEHVEPSLVDEVAEVTEVAPDPVRSGPKTPAESFRELKARKDQLEKENQELMRKVYESQMQSKPQQQIVNEPIVEDFDLQVSDDDLLDGKHGKTLQKQVNAIKRELAQEKQELARERELIRQQSIERDLKEQYPDIGKVLSDDNIAMLEHLDPKFFSGIKANPDTYSKLVSAYLRVKEKGIYKEDIFTADKKRIQENAAKPRLSPAVSTTQPGESPLAKAGMFTDGLTPELMAQLQREMLDARKGY